MTQEEEIENLSQLVKFLNSCLSAQQTIELKDSSISESFRDYQIRDTSTAISFIKNKINIIGMCKKKPLAYVQNADVPFVYEYIFVLKNDINNIGCLAFHKNPRKNGKIKLLIKSLHKDYQNVIPYQQNKILDICWLTYNQINSLPICKGENANELSNL